MVDDLQTGIKLFDWESIIEWEMIQCHFDHRYSYHASLYERGNIICDVGIKFRSHNLKVIVLFHDRNTDRSVIKSQECSFDIQLNNLMTLIKQFVDNGWEEITLDQTMRTEDIPVRDLDAYVAQSGGVKCKLVIHHRDDETEEEYSDWYEIGEGGNVDMYALVPEYSIDPYWTGHFLTTIVNKYHTIDISIVEFDRTEREMCIHIPEEGVYVRGLNLGECAVRTYLHMKNGEYTNVII